MPLDKVILHPKTNEELKMVIEKIQGNTANLLAEWGIKGSLQQAESIKMKKRLFSVIMLFTARPAQERPLSRMQLAHTLNRDLVTFGLFQDKGCISIFAEKWLGKDTDR